MGFYELMYDYLPGYSNFRTVSMALVVVEWSVPLLAALAIYRLCSQEVSLRQIIIAVAVALGVVVVMVALMLSGQVASVGWEILLMVPYGGTITYKEIAEQIAESECRAASARSLTRAVGGAVGHNPISLIIPCHRVLGSDGSLTGYAAGKDKKEQLLRMEGIVF
jgi:O-6-methylguanine DNA methyltransferase